MGQEPTQSSLVQGTRDWEVQSAAIARILQASMGEL